MSNFRSYPKIGQFRNVVKEIRDHYDYKEQPYPTLVFTGTPKLHGTNAAVGYNFNTEELWCQSRNNIITPENDNMGFAKFVEENREDFLRIIKRINTSEEVIFYGEWCGEGIQKGVGISNLPKMFVIFDVLADGVWREQVPFVSRLEGLIKTIRHFPSYSIEIDFQEPEKSINKLAEMTQDVENECPVAKQLGSEGIGEGIVWKLIDRGLFPNKVFRFKVKGEKHSVTKVKKLATVDPEVLESIDNFIEYACTENRLEQGLKEVGLKQESIGSFIGWINKDINKEEADTLEKNNLTMKQVGKKLSNKARTWYIDKLNNFS